MLKCIDCEHAQPQLLSRDDFEIDIFLICKCEDSLVFNMEVKGDYGCDEIKQRNKMKKDEEFTYKKDNKFISGTVIEVHDESYVVHLLGEPYAEVPKSFFDGLERIS